MICTRFKLIGLIALLPAAIAWADPPPPQNTWYGKGQAGFLSSHGNTDAESLNALLDMAYLDGPWKHALHFAALYGSSAGITSAERWEASWQSNYDITSKLFSFGGVRYEHDLFSGFQYQASGSVGLGYKLIDTDKSKLSAQMGVGYRRLRPEEIDKDASGAVVARIPEDSQGDAVVTAEVDYLQNLTGTTSLSNKLLLESGANDTLIKDDVALTVKMSTKLALSLGYGLQDNTKPPPGLKKIDTVTTLNLVYAF